MAEIRIMTTENEKTIPAAYDGATITNMAGRVVNFMIGTKGIIPGNIGDTKPVSEGGNSLTPATVFDLFAKYIDNIGKNTNPIPYVYINEPKTPYPNTTPLRQFKTDEYEAILKQCIEFMGDAARNPGIAAPQDAQTLDGSLMGYPQLLFMASRLVEFYGNTAKNPNHEKASFYSTEPFFVTAPVVPVGILPYLQVSRNCQSDNPTLIAKAKSLVSPTNIFHFVQERLEYSMYYDTLKGAVGAYNSGTANCCDHTHLVNALNRAAGNPARYVHAKTLFGNTWYGHVYAQVYDNGVWLNADSITDSNDYGVQPYPQNTKIIAYYRELPF